MLQSLCICWLIFLYLSFSNFFVLRLHYSWCAVHFRDFLFKFKKNFLQIMYITHTSKRVPQRLAHWKRRVRRRKRMCAQDSRVTVEIWNEFSEERIRKIGQFVDRHPWGCFSTIKRVHAIHLRKHKILVESNVRLRSLIINIHFLVA